MWKRLKRLWFGGKGEGLDGTELDDDATSAESASVGTGARHPDDPNGSARPADPIDPMQAVLEAFDTLLADIGAARAMPELRSLLLQAPDDARLLRRASDLLRELDDESLAELFDAAARVNRAGPLCELAEAFIAMGDPELGLALADAALERAPRDIDALLAGATALAALDRHDEVLDRVGQELAAIVSGTEQSAQLAVRFGISALMLGDLGRFAEIETELDAVAPWLLAAAERVRRFGFSPESPSRRQDWLFSLYGSVLLDDLAPGTRLTSETLGKWATSVASLLGDDPNAPLTLLEPVESLRPTWLTPRGEVMARWIASLLPHRPNPIPLSARLPGQRVMVVICDDAELAQLWELKAFFDAPVPVFQLTKDPAEVDSPLADIIGVLRSDISLPFEALDAERIADRASPKTLANDLQASVGIIDRAAVERFLGWADERRGYLLCDMGLLPDDRPRLGSDGV